MIKEALVCAGVLLTLFCSSFIYHCHIVTDNTDVEIETINETEGVENDKD